MSKEQQYQNQNGTLKARRQSYDLLGTGQGAGKHPPPKKNQKDKVLKAVLIHKPAIAVPETGLATQPVPLGVLSVASSTWHWTP